MSDKIKEFKARLARLSEHFDEYAMKDENFNYLENFWFNFKRDMDLYIKKEEQEVLARLERENE